jgi:hypothetical protein
MNEITLGFSTIEELETFLRNWRKGATLKVDGDTYEPSKQNIHVTVAVKKQNAEKLLAREMNT